MIVWIDAQLPPALAPWLRQQFAVEAYAVKDLNLRDAEDLAIFTAAREAGAVVLTKDADFVALLERHGPPPQIVWVTIGNTSNAVLRKVFERHWPTAAHFFRLANRWSKSGEHLSGQFVPGLATNAVTAAEFGQGTDGVLRVEDKGVGVRTWVTSPSKRIGTSGVERTMVEVSPISSE